MMTCWQEQEAYDQRQIDMIFGFMYVDEGYKRNFQYGEWVQMAYFYVHFIFIYTRTCVLSCIQWKYYI